MGQFLDNKDRKIVPRWRNFTLAASLGELSSDKIQNEDSVGHPSLEKKIQEWKVYQTPSFAADALSSAFVLNQYDRVIDIANVVLSKANLFHKSLVNIAKIVLSKENEIEYPEENLSGNQRIALLRKQLRDDPRDSLSWIDLAREYTIIGKEEKAEKAVDLALNLAPVNRHVIRSASRFFVHAGKPEKAHRILSTAQSLKVDPWILAAQIAVSSILKKRSRHVKEALSLVDGKKYYPFHTSELTSALATIELEEGSTKKARKLFTRSLAVPTENAVAQAQWASNQILNFNLDERSLDIPRSHEARSLHFYHKENWGQALHESILWLNDQQFSSRPAVHASFLASVILEDYQKANELVLQSLKSNKGDFTLLNNLAFSLASDNKVAEAKAWHAKISRKKINGSEMIVFLATSGLLNFRSGDSIAGRHLYLNAINLAIQMSEPRYAALASLFLLREENRISSTDSKEVALGLADKYSKNIEEPYVIILRNRFGLGTKTKANSKLIL